MILVTSLFKRLDLKTRFNGNLHSFSSSKVTYRAGEGIGKRHVKYNILAKQTIRSFLKA